MVFQNHFIPSGLKCLTDILYFCKIISGNSDEKMSKKSKHHYPREKQNNPSAAQPKDTSNLIATISSRGKRVIIGGIVAVIAGFIILAFADPEGRNFASHLAPFVILAGYATIGTGIILPDKKTDLPTEKVATVSNQTAGNNISTAANTSSNTIH